MRVVVSCFGRLRSLSFAAAAALVAGDLGSREGLGKLVIQGLVGAVVYTTGFLIVDREFVRDSFALLVLRPKAS